MGKGSKGKGRKAPRGGKVKASKGQSIGLKPVRGQGKP